MDTELSLPLTSSIGLVQATGSYRRGDFKFDASQQVCSPKRRRVSPRLVQSIRTTARQLGVSELTVRRHLRDGRLQGMQIGGSWRLPGPNIDRIAELPDDCTLTQVAHSLDISEITARRWINSGEIVAIKRNRTWVIKRSDLEEILRTVRGRSAHSKETPTR